MSFQKVFLRKSGARNSTSTYGICDAKTLLACYRDIDISNIEYNDPGISFIQGKTYLQLKKSLINPNINIINTLNGETSINMETNIKIILKNLIKTNPELSTHINITNKNINKLNEKINYLEYNNKILNNKLNKVNNLLNKKIIKNKNLENKLKKLSIYLDDINRKNDKLIESNKLINMANDLLKKNYKKNEIEYNQIKNDYLLKNDEILSLKNEMSLIKKENKYFNKQLFNCKMQGFKNNNNNVLELIIVGINGMSDNLIIFDTNVNKCSVKHLKNEIKQKYNIKNDILLISNHIQLNKDIKLLSFYGITNNSIILVSISKEINIKNNIYESWTSHQQRRVNEFKIEKMIDFDVLTQEINENCIKMPCGHGIPINTLYEYILSEYNNNKQIITCPTIINDKTSQKCGNKWSFNLLKKIFNNNNNIFNKKYFKMELNANKNKLKKIIDYQQCFNCKTLYFKNKKNFTNNYLTNCEMCHQSFCFICGDKWLNKNDKIFCGNNDCSHNSVDLNIAMLQNCKLKTIGDVHNVPSIRACPNCCQLINHSDACKHMDCINCGLQFCFVCLIPKIDDEWQCGSHSDSCPVADKQDKYTIPLPKQFQTINKLQLALTV